VECQLASEAINELFGVKVAEVICKSHVGLTSPHLTGQPRDGVTMQGVLTTNVPPMVQTGCLSMA
jgi:hypothetical protein